MHLPDTTIYHLMMLSMFWLTWCVPLIAIIGVIIFFHLRVKGVKDDQKVLEQKMQRQAAELQNFHQQELKVRIEAEAARKDANRANEELERKNKELEQFVYIASHDLREPLRTTSSFVQLLQTQYKGKFDEKADKYLSFISQASERMTILINDLLDYSRIGNQKEQQQVDCNDLLTEVLTDLGTVMKETDAEINTDLLPVITAYPTSIKQLFQNLIANGIKFRKKGSVPRIRIATHDSNSHWHFSFADNGIGIEQKHRERIFVIFQRLHTRSEYEGSGIGLAHCKKIVEVHGGRIWVDSEPGHGSVFHFTIPKN
jgi:light-regulated signal transduction histidine kinase (bacteriophytochrome)